MGLSPGGEVAQVLAGPSLIGIFLNVGLLGVMITQVNTYYNTFPRDPLWMKLFVAILLVSDVVNSAFNIAWIYNTLVNQFGNVDALASADWLFASEESMAGLTAVMVQCFYAWRILVLTKKWWVVVIVGLSSLVSGTCAIGTAIGVTIVKDFSKFQSLDVIALPWLISCTLCDVLIALSLSMYLRKHKTGFAHTDTVVNKIIRTTVQNGMLTASFTIAHIVAYLASPTGIHMIFNYGVVKLYTNSVMSSLNSRREWVNSLSQQGSSRKDDGAGMSNFVQTNRSLRPQVTINVETHEMVDVGTLSKHDPEWPDMVTSDSDKSAHDAPEKFVAV
ncbi:uncharacterized protein PHACADRAFT_254021 [Phanerochaete carnosa HHB-10118-sp]|uniref:DUF6534 domain-containing protein n=1 Tax=Phanerochaete carnosa (strain HHB-10118-sp) TaxID=650164 RepID=K5WCJ5_PHACS|nr:uncharacterized protein PHACADRAFT_254021 [Phanerochaete carnosa HHB-10118-sp]EKM56729.1 hypothetical protein PHACADRAFT_254021 [Phanerochaete carnosa HHB-10118-sp]